ncbi:MAG: ABC transporter permease [Microbacterium sp.]|nr:ABC transporter permease [Microbacterium sp.]MBN9188693.1 ABC transporter permease [Microbacterium sp.]OJU71505.1 MAG: ABC transporter permease [Microbacterium sp. 70-38]
MIVFLLKRLSASVLLLLAISFIAFMLMAPATGDVARNVLGESATDGQVAALNAQLGLDRPLIVQYLSWLGGMVTGDFGKSYFTSQPVISSIVARLPVTLSIIVLVTLISGVVAFALGMVAAIYRGWVDRVVLILVTLGDALPAFVLALFFVNVFALHLHWLPATGYVPITSSIGGWALTLILPVLSLSILAVAGVAQQVRNSAINVLRMDFVRTIRSRGIPEGRIMRTNVLRNASTNGLTALAVQTVAILGGSVIIEQVFALPGLGSLAVQSTIRADVPIILGIVLTYVVIVMVINLIVDAVIAALNPKVRLS